MYPVTYANAIPVPVEYVNFDRTRDYSVIRWLPMAAWPIVSVNSLGTYTTRKRLHHGLHVYC